MFTLNGEGKTFAYCQYHNQRESLLYKCWTQGYRQTLSLQCRSTAADPLGQLDCWSRRSMRLHGWCHWYRVQQRGYKKKAVRRERKTAWNKEKEGSGGYRFIYVPPHTHIQQDVCHMADIFLLGLMWYNHIIIPALAITVYANWPYPMTLLKMWLYRLNEWNELIAHSCCVTTIHTTTSTGGSS